MKAAIFTSSHNKKYYTVAALYSLLHQDVDFEYAVYVRENSTDEETRELIKSFHDPKLHIEYRNDDDPIAGFNWFYKEAPAEYLFCSHDDIILMPDFLKKMCAVMDEGKDAYCAMQIIRMNKVREFVTLEHPRPYVPSDPPESLHGMMELFQMGIRREIMAKYPHPLYEPHVWDHGGAKSCDVNQNTMDNLQKICELYPVMNGEYTDVLLTHIVTEFSVWNNYVEGR